MKIRYQKRRNDEEIVIHAELDIENLPYTAKEINDYLNTIKRISKKLLEKDALY